MKVSLCAVILSYVTGLSHEYKNLRPIVEDVDTYSSFYTLDTVEIISSGMRQVQLFLDEKMSIPRTNWWWQSTVHIFSFYGFLLFLFLMFDADGKTFVLVFCVL